MGERSSMRSSIKRSSVRSNSMFVEQPKTNYIDSSVYNPYEVKESTIDLNTPM